MYLSNVAIASLAVLGPLAQAHGAGIPHIVGLDVADVRARELIRNLRARLAVGGHSHEVELEARDSPKECGEGIGSCPAGKCCSISQCKYSTLPCRVLLKVNRLRDIRRPLLLPWLQLQVRSRLRRE